MSLTLRIQLLVTLLMGLMLTGLAWREIDGTRRSVHEEVEAANRVAVQVLQVVEQRPFDEALLMLKGLGRVRANRLSLFDGREVLVYTSPESPYKPGRHAPVWFAGLVTPETLPRQIALPDGHLDVLADPSRAVLDGWDDFRVLLVYAGGALLLLSVLTALLLRHSLRPLGRIEAGLRRLQCGHFDTRLPALPGREAALISQAFNDMAQAVQDNFHARSEAREAQADLAQSRELNLVILARVEAERGRIARELHDELGQQLTAVRTLSQVLLQDPAFAQDKAEVAQLLMRTSGEMYDSLHRMLPRLRPLALDRLTLADALHDLLVDWRKLQPGIVFELHLDRLPEGLSDALATALYRITQEAVTNAIKHAEASRVAVSLVRHPAALSLTIADDGKGLPAHWQAPGHYGLLGIQERVAALGGRCSFAPGLSVHRGLSLKVALPWSPHDGAIHPHDAHSP